MDANGREYFHRLSQATGVRSALLKGSPLNCLIRVHSCAFAVALALTGLGFGTESRWDSSII